MTDVPPRNIDQIVATHRAATARRQAGKPTWERSINIKDLLSTDDLSDENCARLGREVAERLKVGLPKTWLENDFELEEIIEHFESITPYDVYPALADFNNALDDLYDWGDARRVWLGI